MTEFKNPRWMLKWLDTALDVEKRKLKSYPIKKDMIPGMEAAQAWSYVVTGLQHNSYLGKILGVCRI